VLVGSGSALGSVWPEPRGGAAAAEEMGRSVVRGDRNQLVACGCTQADEACSTAQFRCCHVWRDPARGLLFAASRPYRLRGLGMDED